MHAAVLRELWPFCFPHRCFRRGFGQLEEWIGSTQARLCNHTTPQML